MSQSADDSSSGSVSKTSNTAPPKKSFFQRKHQIIGFHKASAPDVYKQRALFHRKQPRARQKALGFRRGRQAVDDDVCLRQKFIRFVHGVSIRKPRGQCFTSCAPDARDLRAERGQPPRNICAEVSHAEDERALSADCTALRVLLPDMRLLLAPIDRQRAIKRDDTAQHILGNDRSERAGNIAERNACRESAPCAHICPRLPR